MFIFIYPWIVFWSLGSPRIFSRHRFDRQLSISSFSCFTIIKTKKTKEKNLKAFSSLNYTLMDTCTTNVLKGNQSISLSITKQKKKKQLMCIEKLPSTFLKTCENGFARFIEIRREISFHSYRLFYHVYLFPPFNPLSLLCTQ